MKTHAEWKNSEQELINLRNWRNELKDEVATVSKKIHILSTSINQYKKREKLKNEF